MAAVVQAHGILVRVGIGYHGGGAVEHRHRYGVQTLGQQPEPLLRHRADGAAYPAVRPEIVSETEIAIPTAETSVLDWFSKTVGTILDKMESAKTESRSLVAKRDALLPKLVSGELRVEI